MTPIHCNMAEALFVKGKMKDQWITTDMVCICVLLKSHAEICFPMLAVWPGERCLGHGDRSLMTWCCHLARESVLTGSSCLKSM